MPPPYSVMQSDGNSVKIVTFSEATTQEPLFEAKEGCESGSVSYRSPGSGMKRIRVANNQPKLWTTHTKNQRISYFPKTKLHFSYRT